MFHTKARSAGKDKSLTFSRGPKGCHVTQAFLGLLLVVFLLTFLLG